MNLLKSLLFVIIVLLAGCAAGTIHGLANLALVEPFLDTAIGIENQNLFLSGEEKDTPEFWTAYYDYRSWQKAGQILAGAILGTSVGALFGIVFVYSRKSLPGNSIKKALILAGLMFIAVYLIPFIKYPANPPTVGDPETVVFRGILYLSFTAISGLAAVGFHKVYKRINKKYLAFVGYAGFIAAVFYAMPNNPDPITAPMTLVNNFRIMSAIGVSIFWASLGLIFGVLWHKIRPDKTQSESSSVTV